MQEEDGGHNCLAFVGKILSPAQTRYSLPELEFYCISDILKRYGYMLYGKKIRVHLQYMWSELRSTWPFLSRRIQKAILHMREFGVEAVQIPKSMQKMLDYLNAFPLVQEGYAYPEMNERDRVPPEFANNPKYVKMYVNYF